MKKTLFLAASALFLLAACNESEDAPQDLMNETDASTIKDGDFLATDSISFKALVDNGDSKTWSASAFTLAGQTTLTGCRLDDEMAFHADGTYVYNGGEVLCGAEDNAHAKSGNWEVDFANESIIFDRETQNEEVAKIIGLNENEIRLEASYMMMEVRGVYTSN